MEIIVGDNIYTADDNTLLVLPLFLVHEGTYFPCKDWTDFEDVLNMWAYDLFKYKSRKNVKFALYFEDGPYKLNVIKTGEKVEIQCVNFKSDDLIEKTFSCTYTELLSAVYKASYKVAEILYAKKMHQGKYEAVYNQAILTGTKLKSLIARPT